MPKTSLRAAAAISGTADDVEAAFASAAARRHRSLVACWADETKCSRCPGAPLAGTVANRAAFEQMFGKLARSTPAPARVRKIESLGSAVRNVLERIEVLRPKAPRHAFVLAANVYHKTAQGWRMVAHHEPGKCARADDANDPPQTCADAFLRHFFFRASSPALQSMDYAAPRWLPGGNADHLEPRSPAPRRTGSGLPANAGLAGRRLHRRHSAGCASARPEAAAGAVPWARRLVARVITPKPSRLPLQRLAAWPSRCRISAAAAAS